MAEVRIKTEQKEMKVVQGRVQDAAYSKARAAIGRALRLPYADALEHISHSRKGGGVFPFTISISLSRDNGRGGFQGMDITLGHDGNPAHAQRSVKLDPGSAELCIRELVDWAILEYHHSYEDLPR
jgi:hypothetical protein